MKKKILLLVVLIISIGVVTLLFIRAYRAKKEFSPPPSIEKIQEEEGIPVKTIAPVIMDMEEVLPVDGSIEPKKKAFITSRIDRIIKEITVEEGDPVRKDDIVVLLEKESIESNLQASKTALEEADRDFKRSQALFDSGAIARQDLDQARVELLRRTAIHEISLEGVRDTRITSPLTGLVAHRYKEPGELSDKGKAILEIVDIENVEVHCPISETQIRDIYVGQPIRIIFDAYPGRVWEENITTINPTGSGISRLFTIKISMPNPDLILRPGMYARGEPGVFLVCDGNKVAFTPVRTGIRKRGKVEILSEMEKDCRVVVSGQNRLEDGSKVKVMSGE